MLWLTASLSGFSGSSVGPAQSGNISQKLSLTAGGTDNQEWVSVSDDLATLTVPTIVSGEIRQSDAFFTAGTESFYSNVAGDTIVDKTFENLLVHYYNSNGSNGLWVRKISDTEWKADQYGLNIEFNLSQYNRNVTFYSGNTGASLDGGGDPILDGSGNVIFNTYEDSLTADSVIPPEIIIDPTQLFS